MEVFELTGKPITELQKQNQTTNDIPHLSVGYNKTIIGLTLPKDILYDRINIRVEAMIKNGLIDEVQGLIAKGYSKDLKAFQALGYKEAIALLDGLWTKEQMIEELKKRTRNFAKRQMTWFKRFDKVSWIDASSKPLENMLELIRKT